jgi:hypothetical protein
MLFNDIQFHNKMAESLDNTGKEEKEKEFERNTSISSQTTIANINIPQ